MSNTPDTLSPAANASPYQSIMDAIETLTRQFGAKLRKIDSDDPTKFNGAIRPYTENRGYMAITRSEEPLRDAYSALSFVVFPLKETTDAAGVKTYTVLASICIGTSDLGEDEELASLPYLRRSYTRLLPSSMKNRGFIKTSFTDTVTESTALFEELREGASRYGWDISNLDRYKSLLPAAVILEFTDEDIKEVSDYIDKEGLANDAPNDFLILAAWLAQYAKIRGWDHNSRANSRINAQDNAIRAIADAIQPSDAEIQQEIKRLVEEDLYVVLQGAPGTGKTRAAVKFATDNHYKIFFTQFHAETTYADFVGGIRPRLTGSALGYQYQEGILTQAILFARSHPQEKVLLIIDEINRANLQNVVGPLFYLLERGVANTPADRSEAPVALPTHDGTDISLSALPANLRIIATMNTSDRSLAVVDFALRRRFVWYTLPPLNLGEAIFGGKYQERLFNRMADLFDKYASDEELSLQPGHSYFIAKDSNHMKHRLEYEIMPLMKEYFANGLLAAAQNEFADFYFQETGKFMYR